MSKSTKIENLKKLLENTVSHHGDRTAFMYKDEDNIVKVNYNQYKADIDGLGTSLIDLGLKGSKIIIISENRYEWTVAYMAVMCGTGIAVPLDRSLPENEIRDLIITSEAEAIICADKYIDGVKKLLGNEECKLRVFINMDNTGKDYLSYSDVVAKGKDLILAGNTEFINAEIDADAVGVLLFTSGTTSLSKAVMLSHTNICANVADILEVESIYETDCSLSFLPLHHTFECTIGFLCIIAVGACMSFCEGIRQITKNLKEFKCSIMIGVPLLFENMHKKLWESINNKGSGAKVTIALKVSDTIRKVSKVDISRKVFKEIHEGLGGNLRLFVSGAAAIDPAVLKGFNSFGIEMLQGYGLTETAPVLAAEGNHGKRNGSCGRPMPSVEIKIDNPDETGMGEIIARGPNIMLGYYKNEEATKEVLKNGWFYTGDLGYLDKDGFLFITGRKKNVIVMKSGKKIFPEEVESLLNRDSIVVESFVYGVPEEDEVQMSAKIVYDPEMIKEKHGDLDEKAIHDLIWQYVKTVNKEMPKYKYIKNLTISDEELIKTTTRKIKRHEEMKKIQGQ